MTYFEAIISGLVQGLTEFLPVSSSGHLVILHKFCCMEGPQIGFDILLHIGTLFAVFVYFWPDIVTIFLKERKILLFAVISSIPTIIIGYIFKEVFITSFIYTKMIGAMFFITALFIFAGERMERWHEATKGHYPTGLIWFKAYIIGIAQGIAILPAISRSGATISTGLMLGLKRNEVVRFSFLLSIPAIICALIYKSLDCAGDMAITPQVLAGMFTAFLVGLLAIYIVIKSVLHRWYFVFGIYCVLVGIVVIMLP